MHKSLLDVLVMLGVYLYLFLYFQILNYTLQIYTLLVKFVVARDGQISFVVFHIKTRRIRLIFVILKSYNLSIKRCMPRVADAEETSMKQDENSEEGRG